MWKATLCALFAFSIACSESNPYYDPDAQMGGGGTPSSPSADGSIPGSDQGMVGDMDGGSVVPDDAAIDGGLNGDVLVVSDTEPTNDARPVMDGGNATDTMVPTEDATVPQEDGMVPAFDEDGDGSPQGEDCDDSDPEIFPGAFERCDGIDNDCDQQVDEDWAQLGQLCRVGQGECSADGVLVCRQDGTGVTCDADAGEPAQKRVMTWITIVMDPPTKTSRTVANQALYGSVAVKWVCAHWGFRPVALTVASESASPVYSHGKNGVTSSMMTAMELSMRPSMWVVPARFAKAPVCLGSASFSVNPTEGHHASLTRFPERNATDEMMIVTGGPTKAP